jgi:Tol biopolymer transport system component
MSIRTLVLAALFALALAALLGPDSVAGKGGGGGGKPPKDPPPTTDPDPAIVYLGDSRDLMVMNADGTNQTRVLASGGARMGSPNWSPDAQRIVFPSDILGTPGVCVVNLDGTGLHMVTSLYWAGGRAAWSPDGNRIAFADYTSTPGNGNLPELFVVDVDGTNRTQLSYTEGKGEADPTWSPSGNLLVVKVRNPGGWWGYYDFTADQFNVQQHALPLQLEDGIKGPCFSNTDEYTLAWHTLGDIWVVELDPDDPTVEISQTNITGTPEQGETWPTWSPDDTKIFSKLATGRKFGKGKLRHYVQVMDADGSSPETIQEGGTEPARRRSDP